MPNVLLAIDGSEYARLAAKRAVDLAEERGADLHVLCVVDRRKYSEPALSTTELATIAVEDVAHERVGEVMEMARSAGVDVVAEVRHGIPHEVILKYAEDTGADAIVVGQHGEHREHLGGVRRRVARSADCEVIPVSIPA